MSEMEKIFEIVRNEERRRCELIVLEEWRKFNEKYPKRVGDERIVMLISDIKRRIG